jgi:hypothetical protein
MLMLLTLDVSSHGPISVYSTTEGFMYSGHLFILVLQEVL